MPSILVIDDDLLIRDLLCEALPIQWQGVDVVTASHGDEALDIFFAHEPDVVLLDVTLPVRSGFEVLQQIRHVSDVPVIMLTGRGGETDQVRAFQLGADDYIVKPIGVPLLAARIRAVRGRSERLPHAPGVSELTIGPLTFSFDRQQLAVHGRPVDLTPSELRLLNHLARNAGHVLTYETLMTRVWGSDSYRTANHLRVCVSRLQSKIERAGGPRCIANERSLGYRLVSPPAGPVCEPAADQSALAAY
jgi:two-component system KDP operon response regulator KdpE